MPFPPSSALKGRRTRPPAGRLCRDGAWGISFNELLDLSCDEEKIGVNGWCLF